MRKNTTRVLAAMLSALCLAGTLGGCAASTEGGGAAAPTSDYPPQETAKYGVMTGSTAEQYVMDNYPDAGLFTYPSIPDAVVALGTGKLDYVLTPYTTALNALRKNANLEIYKDNVMPDTSAIAVSKDTPQLLAQLDEVLDQFRADGTLEQVTAHWTTPGADYTVEDLPQAAGANGTLRVAISADREPVCFVMDGAYRGLDCELIERIAYELDMKVEYQNMQFAGLIAALSSGKADLIISNMTPTEERSQTVDFTQSYFDNPQVLLTQKRGGSEVGAAEYTQLSQLEGKKMATLTGSVFDQYVSPLIPDVEFLYFNGIADQLTAVTSGKVEAVTFDEPVARLAVAENPGLVMMEQVLAQHQYAIPATKGNPLVEQASEVVRALRADGTLDEMSARWTGSDQSKKVLPDLPNSGENGTIHVVCYTGSEPMCYMGEGQVTGYEVELCLRIGQALGKQVEFISADFAAMMPMLQSGKADLGIGCVIVTEQRLEMVDMVESHYTGGVRLVVRRLDADPSAARVPEYATLEEISHKTVSALTGSAFDALVKEVLPDISFSYFNSTVDEVSALKGGKVEGVPVDEPVARLFMARNPDLAILPEPVMQDRYGIALTKDSPLTAEVNTVLQDLRD